MKPRLATEEFATGRQTENVHKNRDMKIIACNKNRPYLMTEVQGRTNYINAVFSKVKSIQCCLKI